MTDSAIPTTKDVPNDGEIVVVQEDADKDHVFQARGLETGSRYYCVAHRDVTVGERVWRPFDADV